MALQRQIEIARNMHANGYFVKRTRGSIICLIGSISKMVEKCSTQITTILNMLEKRVGIALRYRVN